MGNTPTFNLPYPELLDVADVPADMHELALAVDGSLDVVDDRVTAEATARANGDQAEATARANADTALTNRIAAEEAARAAADATLTANKVDVHAVVAAATALVESKLAAGSAQQSFRILGDGTIAWGDGAAAPDVTLNRIGNQHLRASGQLTVAGQLNAPQVLLGGDVPLTRGAAGTLQVGNLGATGTVTAFYNGVPQTDRVVIGSPQGGASFRNFVIGPVGGNYGVQMQYAYLYSHAPQHLYTNGHLEAAGDINSHSGGGAAQIGLGTIDLGGGALSAAIIAAGGELTLYRPAADAWRTNNQFQIMGDSAVPNCSKLGLTFSGVGSGAIFCGPAGSGPGGSGRALYVPL